MAGKFLHKHFLIKASLPPDGEESPLSDLSEPHAKVSFASSKAKLVMSRVLSSLESNLASRQVVQHLLLDYLNDTSVHNMKAWPHNDARVKASSHSSQTVFSITCENICLKIMYSTSRPILAWSIAHLVNAQESTLNFKIYLISESATEIEFNRHLFRR